MKPVLKRPGSLIGLTLLMVGLLALVVPAFLPLLPCLSCEIGAQLNFSGSFDPADCKDCRGKGKVSLIRAMMKP
jgi:hypothetical protein